MSALRDLNVYIYPNKIGRNRNRVLESICKKLGGIPTNSDAADIIFIDQGITYSHVVNNLKTFKKNCKIVYTQWLTECTKSKSAVDMNKFVLTSVTEAINHKRKQLHEDDVSEYVKGNEQMACSSNIEASLPSEETSYSYPVKKVRAAIKTDSWVCAHSSVNKTDSINQYIIDKLKELSEVYNASNDVWRAYGYQRAITAIKAYPKKIESKEEVLKMRGIGKRIANKIAEVIEFGSIEKLQYLNEEESTNVLKQFADIYGVGPMTAMKLYQMGYRSLEELRNNDSILTKNQKIGLKYYDELLKRIPRDECTRIASKVKDAALKIKTDIKLEVCGSYRRKKPTCGDIDILITHKDDNCLVNLFEKLIASLTEDGFLTDDLLFVDNEGQKKYLGICKLNEEGAIHRRIDIIVVPYHENACALLYFTGSAHFNRSMRSLASRLGMHLSEHYLKRNIVRNSGLKLTDGVIINTPTEESVFRELDIPYRVPHERDF